MCQTTQSIIQSLTTNQNCIECICPPFFLFSHGKPSHLSLSRSRVCLLTASQVPANSASLMSPPLYPVVDYTAAPVGLCFAFFKKNRCNRKKWGELSHACSNRPSLRNSVQEMGWMNSQRFWLTALWSQLCLKTADLH